MQVKNPHQELSGEPHYIHLAAVGAPTLDIPVRYADEASKLFSLYRDKYGFGASEMEAECGSIYDCQNRRVGRISYNGRIWDANSNPIE
jgi:membrane-bound ClpP family serine protease